MRRVHRIEVRLRHRYDQAGAAAVEFALIATILLTLVFGIVQYGMYFFSAQAGSAAAREAARRASVGACTDAALKTFVYNRLSSGAIADDITDPAFTVVRTFYQSDGTTSVLAPGVVGGVVKVSVTFRSLNFNFPFVPFLSDATVQRVVDARLENTTSTGACV